jgi:hypothetical protein
MTQREKNQIKIHSGQHGRDVNVAMPCIIPKRKNTKNPKKDKRKYFRSTWKRPGCLETSYHPQKEKQDK